MYSCVFAHLSLEAGFVQALRRLHNKTTALALPVCALHYVCLAAVFRVILVLADDTRCLQDVLALGRWREITSVMEAPACSKLVPHEDAEARLGPSASVAAPALHNVLLENRQG